jgi:hypothetical protein
MVWLQGWSTLQVYIFWCQATTQSVFLRASKAGAQIRPVRTMSPKPQPIILDTGCEPRAQNLSRLSHSRGSMPQNRPCTTRRPAATCQTTASCSPPMWYLQCGTFNVVPDSIGPQQGPSEHNDSRSKSIPLSSPASSPCKVKPIPQQLARCSSDKGGKCCKNTEKWWSHKALP